MEIQAREKGGRHPRHHTKRSESPISLAGIGLALKLPVNPTANEPSLNTVSSQLNPDGAEQRLNAGTRRLMNVDSARVQYPEILVADRDGLEANAPSINASGGLEDASTTLLLYPRSQERNSSNLRQLVNIQLSCQIIPNRMKQTSPRPSRRSQSHHHMPPASILLLPVRP